MAIIIFYGLSSVEYYIYSFIRNMEFCIVSIFLILSGKKQPENLRYSSLLIKCGLINILATLSFGFFPYMYSTDSNLLELALIKVYYHIRYLYTPVSLFLTYGIMFWVFGRVNKKEIDIFMQAAGIFMTLASIFEIFIISIYLNFSFSHSQPQPGFALEGYQYFYTVTALVQVRTTTYTLGLIFMVIHCKENHDKMLAYGVLILIIYHATDWLLRNLINTLF